jgi:exodeoxyribonuclease V alpha subunit
VGLLTGGPGTGKTHTSAVVIKAAMELGLSVGAVTPTGIAAVRLTNAMSDRGLNLVAETTHTALQPLRTGYDGQGWHFRHCESDPLPFDFLLCDEESMVDLEMMAKKLAAVQPGTQLLLVGDPDQLPPVGGGKPFCDLIKAGLPHGHLTEIHRFAGRIAHVCRQIREGQPWEPSGKVDLTASSPENMRHIECHAASVPQTLLDLIPKLKSYGFTSPDQIQIICPCNSAGNLSRERLNRLLQDFWNPSGRRAECNPFRVGDKIMISKNWFYEEGQFTRNQQGCAHYIANGEIGRVVMNDARWTEAEFGGRTIRVPIKFDKPPQPAFSITGHKSQGSQWPCVITVADGSGAADRVCSRAWWYTVISRAGQLSVTLGQRAAIDRHCLNVALDQRKTFLSERLKERWAA